MGAECWTAVSDTASTVTFKPTEIIRTSDAFADSPAVRRLLSDRHTNLEGTSKLLQKRVVMNDVSLHRPWSPSTKILTLSRDVRAYLELQRLLFQTCSVYLV